MTSNLKNEFVEKSENYMENIHCLEINEKFFITTVCP